MYFKNTHAISRDTSCRNHWICQVPWCHFVKKPRNFGQELNEIVALPLHSFYRTAEISLPFVPRVLSRKNRLITPLIDWQQSLSFPSPREVTRACDREASSACDRAARSGDASAHSLLVSFSNLYTLAEFCARRISGQKPNTRSLQFRWPSQPVSSDN